MVTMISEVLRRSFVLEQMSDMTEHLTRAKIEVGARSAEGLPEEAGDLDEGDFDQAIQEVGQALAREEAASSGHKAEDQTTGRDAGATPLDEQSFFSRDPVISLFQSALEQYFDDKEPERVSADSAGREAGQFVPVSDRRLVPPSEEAGRVLGKFEITDPGWLSCLVAVGVRRLRRRREFNPKPASPREVSDKVRIILVGDWGTGISRAEKVAAKIKAYLKDGDAQDRHVIHLGDVYYAGWAREYKRRFLPFWPVEPRATSIGSWSLNGNHDMYSGGCGYFNTLLEDPRFAAQGQSSLFSLHNSDWEILGLDSAWTDKALTDPEPDWVEERSKASSKKLLLLSHHQLFSVYEHAGDLLREQLSGPLSQGRITSWFWGHEHGCVVYEEHMNVAHASCLGHGGVPTYMSRGPEDGYQPPVKYEYREFKDHGFERWAYMGFAVLDFDGGSIRVRYVNEDGVVHYEASIS
jgi:Calcineurin-like phosphoesterase